MRNKIINIAFLFLPLLFAVVYVFLIAEDRYVSVSKFTIKTENEIPMPTMTMGLLGGASSSAQDQLIIRDKIFSHNLTEKIINKYGVDTYLSSQYLDLPWRIFDKDDKIEINNQIQRLVSVIFDDEASITTIEVQSFGATEAQAINKFLLEETIDFMNEFSDSVSQKYIDFAEKEVQRSQVRLSNALDALQAFQKDNKIFSPEMNTSLATNNLATLESNLAQEKVNLAELSSYLQDNSQKIINARKRITALEDLITKQKNNISFSNTNDFTKLNRKFLELSGTLEFATKAHEASLIALETATQKALQSQKNIMIIEEPSLPNKAEKPEPAQTLIVLILFIVMANIIMRLGLTMFREYN